MKRSRKGNHRERGDKGEIRKKPQDYNPLGAFSPCGENREIKKVTTDDREKRKREDAEIIKKREWRLRRKYFI